jgi:hypothetical protein
MNSALNPFYETIRALSRIFIFISSFGFAAAVLVNISMEVLFSWLGCIPGVSCSLLYSIGGGPLVIGQLTGVFYMFYGSVTGSIAWLALKLYKNREIFEDIHKLEQFGDLKILTIFIWLVIAPILLGGVTFLAWAYLSPIQAMLYPLISALFFGLLMLFCRIKTSPFLNATASVCSAMTWVSAGVALTTFLIVLLNEPAFFKP